jgi:hypothetical protein
LAAPLCVFSFGMESSAISIQHSALSIQPTRGMR